MIIIKPLGLLIIVLLSSTYGQEFIKLPSNTTVCCGCEATLECAAVLPYDPYLLANGRPVDGVTNPDPSQPDRRISTGTLFNVREDVRVQCCRHLGGNDRSCAPEVIVSVEGDCSLSDISPTPTFQSTPNTVPTREMTTPTQQPPTQEMTTPTRQSPTQEMTTPTRQSPTQEMTTPTRQSPTREMTTPTRQSPTREMTTPTRQSPTREMTTPTRQSPTREMTTPTRQSPTREMTTPTQQPPTRETTTPNEATNSTTGRSSITTWIVVGCTVGGVIVLAVITAALAIVICKRMQHQRRGAPHASQNGPQGYVDPHSSQKQDSSQDDTEHGGETEENDGETGINSWVGKARPVMQQSGRETEVVNGNDHASRTRGLPHTSTNRPIEAAIARPDAGNEMRPLQVFPGYHEEGIVLYSETAIGSATPCGSFETSGNAEIDRIFPMQHVSSFSKLITRQPSAITQSGGSIAVPSPPRAAYLPCDSCLPQVRMVPELEESAT